MRSFLRADPDVIMVGEMRDKETTKTGVEASLTGHLVLATLHTNSAPESVLRLLDMGMDPFNFADALLGTLAQRLAKTLCGDCRQAYEPDKSELEDLAAEYCHEQTVADAADSAGHRRSQRQLISRWREERGDSGGRLILYRAAGCEHCGQTGYRGRIGLHELLVNSDVVKDHILSHAPVSDIFRTALDEGMRTLKQDGFEKILQGHTDIHQVRKVCVK